MRPSVRKASLMDEQKVATRVSLPIPRNVFVASQFQVDLIHPSLNHGDNPSDAHQNFIANANV